MHPVIAQAIVAEQIRDLKAEAAAERQARQARQAGRCRRPRLAMRLRRAGHVSRPAAAPCPARDPAAA
jgi:hypothetical protein